MQSTMKTIREWRAFWKLDKADVARQLEIHPNTYARYEDDPTQFRIKSITKLAEIFRCNPNEIIFFEQSPNINLGLSTEGGEASTTAR